jgi:hypothetical protein
MGNEIVSLARDVFTGDGRFATLLTTDKTFVNEKLADIYGISGVTGGAMVPAKLDRAQRPFLLTRAAFLAMGANAYEGDPTKRGKLLREQLLCQRLSAPPPGVPPLPSDPTKTVRERHEAHFRDASCAGCHKLTDLVGFGFEHYDAIGKWREVDRGQPVDDRGTVVNIDGHDVPFTGPTELAKIFAESDEVRRCVATQWTRYAYGREEVPADDVSAKAILSAFRASDHDLRALVVAIVKSRSFRYRAPSPGEVLE